MSELYDRILDRAREIRTDGYSMSIGEVISLYRDGDLDIHPEFQRIFRWDIDQRSRLVESILLGIPIPTIFVAQRDDGVWDVIDGVQRLSTILEFIGDYKDENDEQQPGSVLSGGEYLEELAGVGWDETTPDATSYFDERIRRDFKRAKLIFSIIKRESDPNAKFDLFQRLNAGSTLSPQEARNCLLVMIDRPSFLALSSLSDDSSFGNCISVSEQKESAAYKSELVLRFFCQLQYDGGVRQLPGEFGTYLTNWMKNEAESKRGDFLNADLFHRTFDLLSRTTGADTFRRHDGTRHLGSFSISSFEYITAGVAANIELWETGADSLPSKIQQIWETPSFRENSGTGISSRRRFPRLVHGGREFFSKR